MSHVRNWADILNRQVGYVVLRKGNRMQVICRPSAKQLRRRGKRHWRLVAATDAVDGSSAIPEEVREAVRDALQELAEKGARQEGKVARKTAKKARH